MPTGSPSTKTRAPAGALPTATTGRIGTNATVIGGASASSLIGRSAGSCPANVKKTVCGVCGSLRVIGVRPRGGLSGEPTRTSAPGGTVTRRIDGQRASSASRSATFWVTAAASLGPVARYWR
jgi:hypothetical protein